MVFVTLYLSITKKMQIEYSRLYRYNLNKLKFGDCVIGHMVLYLSVSIIKSTRTNKKWHKFIFQVSILKLHCVHITRWQIM